MYSQQIKQITENLNSDSEQARENIIVKYILINVYDDKKYIFEDIKIVINKLKTILNVLILNDIQIIACISYTLKMDENEYFPFTEIFNKIYKRKPTTCDLNKYINLELTISFGKPPGNFLKTIPEKVKAVKKVKKVKAVDNSWKSLMNLNKDISYVIFPSPLPISDNFLINGLDIYGITELKYMYNNILNSINRIKNKIEINIKRRNNDLLELPFLIRDNESVESYLQSKEKELSYIYIKLNKEMEMGTKI